MAQNGAVDLVAERLLDEGEQILGLGLLLLGLLLLLLGLEAEILDGDVAEGLVGIAFERVDKELVDLIHHAEDLIALLVQLLGLREGEQTADVVAAGEVDLRLLGGHGIDVLLQGDHAVLAHVVEQEILDLVDLVAVFADDAGAEHHAEVLIELLVLRAVVLHHLGQLVLHLLAEVRGDELELAVMLQHLAGDVQAEIRGVHDAAREGIAVGEQIGALVHDHDAGAVELETRLALAGVELLRGLGGDEDQRAIADHALGVDADDGERIVVVVEVLLVERDALLVRRLLAAALPDRHHGVDGLFDEAVFHLHLRLAVFVELAGFDHLVVLDLHDDRPADVVGILAHEHHDLPVFEIGAVLLAVGVLLDVHDDLRADGILLGLGDRVAVRAGGDPLVRLVGAVGFGDDGDLIGHHEGGIEADAELTDDVDGGVLLLFLVESVLEAERAAAGDDAEVLLELFLRHADAVVGDGDRARFLVHVDADLEVAALHADVLIRERTVAELVDRVGRVGDDLTQEDFLVRVDRVDHHVQELLGLRFELLLCHVYASIKFNYRRKIDTVRVS